MQGNKKRKNDDYFNILSRSRPEPRGTYTSKVLLLNQNILETCKEMCGIFSF